MVRLYDRAMREVKEYYEEKLEEVEKTKLEAKKAKLEAGKAKLEVEKTKLEVKKAKQELERYLEEKEKKRKQEIIGFYNNNVPIEVISSALNIQEEEILSLVQEDLNQQD